MFSEPATRAAIRSLCSRQTISDQRTRLSGINTPLNTLNNISSLSNDAMQPALQHRRRCRHEIDSTYYITHTRTGRRSTSVTFIRSLMAQFLLNIMLPLRCFSSVHSERFQTLVSLVIAVCWFILPMLAVILLNALSYKRITEVHVSRLLLQQSHHHSPPPSSS